MKSPVASIATDGNGWPPVVLVLTSKLPSTGAPALVYRWPHRPTRPLGGVVSSLCQTTTKSPSASIATDGNRWFRPGWVFTFNWLVTAAPDRL
jgi:hypothetical protein